MYHIGSSVLEDLYTYLRLYFLVFFGIIIIDCNLKTFLALWLPSYILKRFALDKVEGHRRSSTWNKIYETILTPLLYSEVLKELFGFSKKVFDVSPKVIGSTNKMTKLNKKLLRSHLILLIINIIGFAMCLIKIKSNINIAYLYILSIVWTFSNIFYLIISIIFYCKSSSKQPKEFIPNRTTTYSRKALLKLFFGGKNI